MSGTIQVIRWCVIVKENNRIESTWPNDFIAHARMNQLIGDDGFKPGEIYVAKVNMYWEEPE